MTRTRMGMTAVVLAIGILGGSLGCKKEDPPPPANNYQGSKEMMMKMANTGGPPGLMAFRSNNCGNCHAMGGEKDTGKGPSLAAVGKDEKHTVDWLVEHIKNPKAHVPDSKMPGFEGKIDAATIKQIAEFLATLK
jgi:mono/diheme cytochrome c family protein